jgi:hypothetical protein
MEMLMTLDLPPPIAAYADANARLDLDGMLSVFAADAVVVDEQRRRTGRAEIRDWIQSAITANRAVFIPDSCRMEGAAVVVEGPSVGEFPGSPIRFTFRFTLQRDTVSTLEIA